MSDTNETNVIPMQPVRPLDEAAALAWLRAQPGGRTNLPAAELARRWGWQRYNVSRRLQRWKKDGTVAQQGRFLVAVDITPPEVATNGLQHIDDAPELGSQPGRSVAVRNAAERAATVAAPASGYVARLVQLDDHRSTPVAVEAPVELSDPPWAVPRPVLRHAWSAFGRALVGLAIVGTGAWIAYTSMRGNAWFGHSLTPDPAAGEIYSNLSVAAEIMACLIPTAIRFYWQGGEPWAALRGWALMVVALVVVFFAAGGFAITNIHSGVEARMERETPAMRDLRTQLAGLDRSIASECAKRGDRCRELERQRADANTKLATERAGTKADADPQAVALGISSLTLHLVQAGAMVALCLFSGLFISFGAGLIWSARWKAQDE
jgi:MarR family